MKKSRKYRSANVTCVCQTLQYGGIFICNLYSIIVFQKDYCLCKTHLTEVRRADNSACPLACEGDLTQTCGGPLGVSLYQAGVYHCCVT